MTRCLMLALLTIALAACGGGGRRKNDDGPPPGGGDGRGGERRNEQRAMEERPSEKRDDKHDERVEDRTGWEKLGERVVHGGKGDRDVIEVGGHEGQFSRVMIVVEHSAMHMSDLEITFGDGSNFSPGTKFHFNKNTTTRVIDLPGQKRVIRKVAFKYGNVPGGGRAQVELWAK